MLPRAETHPAVEKPSGSRFFARTHQSVDFSKSHQTVAALKSHQAVNFFKTYQAVEIL